MSRSQISWSQERLKSLCLCNLIMNRASWTRSPMWRVQTAWRCYITAPESKSTPQTSNVASQPRQRRTRKNTFVCRKSLRFSPPRRVDSSLSFIYQRANCSTKDKLQSSSCAKMTSGTCLSPNSKTGRTLSSWGTCGRSSTSKPLITSPCSASQRQRRKTKATTEAMTYARVAEFQFRKLW